MECFATLQAQMPTVELASEQHPDFAMTVAEYEVEIDKPFPGLLLRAGVGPEFDYEWLDGIAGDIIRKASQHTEAHPVSGANRPVTIRLW